MLEKKIQKCFKRKSEMGTNVTFLLSCDCCVQLMFRKATSDVYCVQRTEIFSHILIYLCSKQLQGQFIL